MIGQKNQFKQGQKCNQAKPDAASSAQRAAGLRKKQSDAACFQKTKFQW